MIVNEFHPIDTAFAEVFHQLPGQHGSLRVGRLVSQMLVIRRGRIAHLFHRLGHLAADAIDRHLRVPERLDGLQGQPHGIGIEGAA